MPTLAAFITDHGPNTFPLMSEEYYSDVGYGFSSCPQRILLNNFIIGHSCLVAI